MGTGLVFNCQYDWLLNKRHNSCLCRLSVRSIIYYSQTGGSGYFIVIMYVNTGRLCVFGASNSQIP
jgi:hypothetical protein